MEQNPQRQMAICFEKDRENWSVKMASKMKVAASSDNSQKCLVLIEVSVASMWHLLTHQKSSLRRDGEVMSCLCGSEICLLTVDVQSLSVLGSDCLFNNGVIIGDFQE